MLAATVPSIGNLQHAISDVYYSTAGGLFRPDYDELLRDLGFLVDKFVLLSPTYQDNVLKPFIAFLVKLTKADFDTLFTKDVLTAAERSLKKSIEEVAEALLQRNHQHKYYESSFRDLLAFQAVVTTIYEDVLRTQISKLAQIALAPLARWGNRKGPSTLPLKFTSKVGVRAGIVNLPPEHRTGGLLAWASIGHEVGGHHLLHFDKSLIPQLQEAIRTGILKELPATEEVNILSEYWGACADELASDVLGVLNIGTCFGIALLGYLRGKRGGKLNNTGPLHTMKGQVMHAVKLFAPSGNVPSMFIHRVSDNVILAKDAGHFGYLKPNREDPFFYEKFSFPSGKHPVDVLRPFCIAKTIEIIDAKSEWIQLTKGEALKDFDPNGKLVLNGLEGDPPTLKPVSVDSTLAIKTAEIAAEVVARTPISCLEGKCLLELVSWSVRDEVLVDEIRQGLVQDLERLPDLPIPGVYYARHVVAASVLESIKEGSNIERVFNAMKRYLVDAYNKIPNPISVGHVEEKLMAQVDEDSSGSDNEYYFQ